MNAQDTSTGRYAQFADIRKEVSELGGQYIELPTHVIVHIPGKDRLVATFDNRAALNSNDQRRPWGDKLILEQGWGCLGVMAIEQNWYRCPDLYPTLETLVANTLVPAYSGFSLYGNSMGGFGALTFSRLFPDPITVTFNPQTSLMHDVVPFERRFEPGRGLGDWTGPYVDGAEGAACAAKNYVFYDPMVVEDKLHALRLVGANSVMFPCPWLTHPFMPVLASMQLLKPSAVSALEGTLTRKTFFDDFRRRRFSDRYMQELLTAAVSRGHSRLARAALEKRLLQRQSNQGDLLEGIVAAGGHL